MVLRILENYIGRYCNCFGHFTSEAFDKVPHKRLLYKLDFYGIRGSTHKWIDSWLSERSQKVVLDGRASDPVPVLSGVPQGSVLGPVLFLIFINDLPDNIRSSVRLFADDCVLYRNVKSPLDCQILQGILRKLHTKHWFGLNLSMQLLFGIPIMKLRLRWWRRCRGLLPGGPAGDGGSVGEMLDELEWPSLESRRERSSLTFFYKIHPGTVSLDKDKYLTPAPNLRHTRASHESQYTRPFAYSDALKNSFFPRTIPVWNSLPSSVVLSKTIEEFKASI